MNVNAFITDVQDILQTDQDITIDMRLVDIEEWDSLVQMAMMAYFDKHFGKQVSLTEISQCKTVAALVALAGDPVQ